MQEFGGLVGTQRGALVLIEIDGRILLERLAFAFAAAGEHQIDAAATDFVARARLQLQEPGLSTALRPYAEQLFGNAFRAFDRRPLIARRIHHDWRVIAAFWINHVAPMPVLPDRLIRVHITLAGHAFAA